MAHFEFLLLVFGIFVSVLADNSKNKVFTGTAHRIRRLAGGLKTNHKLYPYQVRVFGRYGQEANKCGGTIIDDYHVISAAHCFVDRQFKQWKERSFLVVAGATNFNIENPATWVTASVRKVYIPKIYIDSIRNDVAAAEGDIAVLKLEKSLDLLKNNHIEAALLPNDEKNLYINKMVDVTGYGKGIRKEKSKLLLTPGGHLRSFKTTVLSNIECQSDWDNFTQTHGWRKRIITKRHICARVLEQSTVDNEGICEGDSGGPLVYNRKVLIGVVNSGLDNCDETIIPGRYARVSAFKDFIHNARNDIEVSEILTFICPIISWEYVRFDLLN